MKVVLFKGTGFVSWAIKFQTRTDYSHAALWTEAGDLIEAMYGKGVVISKGWYPPEGVAVFSIVGWSDAHEARALEFLKPQIGKGYDKTMVVRFLTRFQESRKSKGKWFCSELVFAAVREGGVELFARTEPWEVSPGMLNRSVRLFRLN